MKVFPLFFKKKKRVYFTLFDALFLLCNIFMCSNMMTFIWLIGTLYLIEVFEKKNAFSQQFLTWCM